MKRYWSLVFVCLIFLTGCPPMPGDVEPVGNETADTKPVKIETVKRSLPPQTLQPITTRERFLETIQPLHESLCTLLDAYQAILVNYEPASSTAKKTESQIISLFPQLQNCTASYLAYLERQYDAKLQEGLRPDAPELQAHIAEMDKIKQLSKLVDIPIEVSAIQKIRSKLSMALPLLPLNAGSKPGQRLVRQVKGVEFAFRWCPPGEFMMGSPTSESGRDSDETQHRGTISKGFWMMETEITQAQWQAVMGTNPSDFRGENLPVESISWDDCQEFCKKCSALGLQLRLPSEAQWEYACRAGTTGAYAGDLDAMAWYDENSGSKTHPVGTKKANAWGLYDMHGNVWEWCADAWQEDISSNNTDKVTDKGNGSRRVARGGCWYDYAKFCRSASRGGYAPDFWNYDLGARCVGGQ